MQTLNSENATKEDPEKYTNKPLPPGQRDRRYTRATMPKKVKRAKAKVARAARKRQRR